MNDPNKHITNYLDHYCTKMENPGFAILIKGDWGSGKTWYIKDYIDKKRDDRFIYLSLYGLNDTREIDDLIFEKIHPFLGSKPVVFVGKIFKSALRLGLKVDLDSSSDSAIQADSSIPDIPLSDLTKKIESKIFVFDDLERNKIDPTSLLGYINTFIEHQKMRVILIGDEQKILKRGVDGYPEAKEKIIGHTFNILPQPDNALKSFISEIKDEKCHSLMESMELELLKLFNKINYDNLRDLRQSLLSFEYLYINIDDDYKNYSPYFEKLLSAFIYLSLELKANQITQENWEEAVEIFFYKELSQKDFVRLDEEEKNKILETARFSRMLNRHNIPLGSLLFDIIYNGRIVPQKINSAIKNSQDFLEKDKTTLIKLLSEWNSQNSLEFKTNYDLFILELQKLKYRHPGELLHSAGLLILMSDIGIIPINKEEVINFMGLIIERIISENKLVEYSFDYGFPEDYGGFGFAKRDTKEFKIIWERLKDELNIKNKTNLIKDVNQMIDLFPASYTEFNNALILVGVDGKFSYDPVLSFIDTSTFFSKYHRIPNNLKRYFIYALRNRYELKYSNGVLREQFFDEERFLIEFKEIIDNKITSEEKLYNVDNFILQDISNELNSILEYFKKHLNDKSLQSKK